MPGKNHSKKHAKKHHRKHRQPHASERVLSPLEMLPDHILHMIFSNLGLSDLAELMLASKQFSIETKNDEVYWKNTHAHHFREEMLAFRALGNDVVNWYEHFKSTYRSTHHYIYQEVSRELTLIKSGDLERFKREAPEAGYSVDHLTSHEKKISALATCPSQALRDYVYRSIILPRYTINDKTIELERTNTEINPLIYWAVILNQLSAIKHFISIHANFCLLDSRAQLPLNYAILAGNLTIVELLLSHMGNFLTENTLLEQSGIIFHNIEPLQQAARLQYLDIVKALVAHGLDPDGKFRAIRYTPPITIAAQVGNHDIAAFLLSLSIDTNAISMYSYFASDARTALHFAVENQDIKMIQLLLEHNANIEDVQNTNGTPLMLAVLKKSYQTAECLLTHKANPNTPNTSQLYPIDAGAKTQNHPMLKLLLASVSIK